MAERSSIGHNHGVTITTASYRLGRYELMLLTALEYLRSFWWFVIITPIFGVVAIAFGSGLLQVIGMMAVLWPFSIPARAILSTNRSARLFTGGCHLVADEDKLIFLADATEPKRLRMVLEPPAIRDAVERGRYLLVRTRRLGFAPILRSAFQGNDELVFAKMVSGMLEERDDIAASETS